MRSGRRRAIARADASVCLRAREAITAAFARGAELFGLCKAAGKMLNSQSRWAYGFILCGSGATTGKKMGVQPIFFWR
jgi:hypothetical protein